MVRLTVNGGHSSVKSTFLYVSADNIWIAPSCLRFHNCPFSWSTEMSFACFRVLHTSSTLPAAALPLLYVVVVWLFQALLLNQFSWLTVISVPFSVAPCRDFIVMSGTNAVFCLCLLIFLALSPYLLWLVNISFMTELVLFMSWHSWHLLYTNQLSLCAISC